MTIKLTLAGFIGAGLLAASPAFAAPPVSRVAGDAALLQKVGDGHRRHHHHHHRGGPSFGIYIGEGRRHGRCSYWRDECGDRWAYGTWRYDRCLARRGC